MRAGIGTTSLGCMAAFSAVLSLAHPAIAQDSGTVSDYRLPEPTQTARPTVQGPVDPENPLSSPTRTPAPVITPTPVPAPTISLPPSTTPAATPTPRASRRPNAVPQADEPTPAPQVTATPDATLLAPEALPEVESSSPPSGAADATIPTSSDDGPVWLLPGLAGAALLGLGAFLFQRRRRPSAQMAAEPEVPSPPAPPPSAPHPPVTLRPVPPPQPDATPDPIATPEPVPLASTFSTADALPLTTALTVKALRLSLVYATLQYELDVTNAGTQDLPALQVHGDLASAHASVPVREQLAPPPAAMEAKHAIEPLRPGDTVTLKGELRLPLQQIRPVTKGNAHFLVPLARFCILAPDGAAVRRVFSAGPQEQGSETIASIRLDAGPRNLRELATREIEAARSFVLDPVGAQG